MCSIFQKNGREHLAWDFAYLNKKINWLKRNQHILIYSFDMWIAPGWVIKIHNGNKNFLSNVTNL